MVRYKWTDGGGTPGEKLKLGKLKSGKPDFRFPRAPKGQLPHVVPNRQFLPSVVPLVFHLIPLNSTSRPPRRGSPGNDKGMELAQKQTKATKKNSSFVSYPSVQKKSVAAKILKSVQCAEEQQPLSALFASLKIKLD
jgi:hypothetical protein